MRRSTEKRSAVAFYRAASHYDLIIAEGAGSCAEPNLRRPDVVNMRLAHLLEFVSGSLNVQPSA